MGCPASTSEWASGFSSERCPASPRNRVRLQVGVASGIASEYLAGISRNLHCYKFLNVSDPFIQGLALFVRVLMPLVNANNSTFASRDMIQHRVSDGQWIARYIARRMARQNVLPPTLTPRLITRTTAPAYLSISPWTFDKLVAAGMLPLARFYLVARLGMRGSLMLPLEAS